MARTIFSFDEPDLREGRITSQTKNGVTITFESATQVFRPAVSNQGPWALRNLQNEEMGWLSPVLIRFSQLVQRVRVSVGLDTRDWSVAAVTATLRAYDARGNEITANSAPLGLGPTSITVPLEVTARDDSIAMISISYSGNNAEVFDELELEALGNVSPPPDNIPPVVTIQSPQGGQTVNDPVVWVTGQVVEVSGVRLTINGAPVPVQRTGPTTWHFAAWAALTGDGRILAQATDEAGLTGQDEKRLVLRVPAVFRTSDVRFTQTGLLGPGTAQLQTRRIAGKTSLFRLQLTVRTAGGEPAFVDGGTVSVEGGSRSASFAGHPPPSGGVQFSLNDSSARLGDGTTYFFIDGRALEAGYRYRFVLRLYVRNQLVSEQVLAEGWQFRAVRGLGVLIAPQHRPLSAEMTGGLLRTLNEMARIYPVPDGAVSLTGERGGGIRFALLPPTDYQGHTDPADAAWRNREIAFEDGYLLRDHLVEVDPGPDGRWNTGNEIAVLQAGEYLPINFSGAEDANRNGSFDEEERARLRGGNNTPMLQRYERWGRFVRTDAAVRRFGWNIQHAGLAPERLAHRAVATPTATPARDAFQNRTGLAGNAGPGEVSFWADVEPEPRPGAFIPHEVGHSYRLDRTQSMHTETSTDPTTNPMNRCVFLGEAVNLLTRQIIPTPTSLMCSGVGDVSGVFLAPTEYDFMFDQFSSRGWVVD